jgi:type I restriction enzyme M protein
MLKNMPMLQRWKKSQKMDLINIPRYVDTFEKEEEIDLNAVSAEIKQLQTEIKSINTELKPYFDELGLDFPFAEEN